MIVAIEHTAPAAQENVTELHCKPEEVDLIVYAIRRLTGEHPVPVALSACEVALFSHELNLDRGCALLRIIREEGINPAFITMDLLDVEIQLQKELTEKRRINLDDHPCSCRYCRGKI